MNTPRQSLRKSPSKKRVHFHSNVVVREVSKIGNPSEQWYSKPELKEIGLACLNVISFFIRNHGTVSPSIIETRAEDSIRGLESALPGEREKRARMIIKSVDAVLDEQDQQRRLSICDPNTIAAVYLHAAQKSRLDALHYGLRDERDILMEDMSSGAEVHGRIRDIIDVVSNGTPNTRRRQHRKLINAVA